MEKGSNRKGKFEGQGAEGFALTRNRTYLVAVTLWNKQIDQ